MPRSVDIEWIKQQNKCHRGKYITVTETTRYQKLAEKLPNTHGQMIGERRVLCLKLMEEYGLNEIEATNILNGYHSGDYTNKYYRIKHEIPIERKSRCEYDREENDDE